VAAVAVVGIAAVLILGSALPAGAALCVAVDPLVSIGCGSASSGKASSAQRSAAAGQEDDSVPLSSTTVELDPQRIAVTAAARATPRQLRTAFAAAGVELEQAIPQIRSYLVHVAPERQDAAVRSLLSSPSIVGAAPDVIAHALDTTPNDTEWPLQTGLRVIGLPRAWDTSRGSSALVVAVVDTGVDPGQPDLRGALVAGRNFLDPASSPRDDHGHGTAVAGVLAARADNGQGMAGVCWFCLVMPVKVLDSSGSGDDTRIAAGIVWAVDHGARVLNLSLGGPGTTPQLAAALAYAESKGAVVVAAAGNSGTSVPFYPAAGSTVLGVAATTAADRPYSWSNYGPWVGVAAPGCNVAPSLGGGYTRFCGTSSATPIVAGLAALAVSEQPRALPAEIRRALETVAAPLPGFVQFGRVDAPRALAAVGAARRRVTDVRAGVLTRAQPTLTYDVPSTPGPLTATVRLAGASKITLSVVAQGGGQLAHSVGRNRARVSEPVPGPVTVTVRASGPFPARFVLKLSYTQEGGGGG
jgi:subtilisin family serine protease